MKGSGFVDYEFTDYITHDKRNNIIEISRIKIDETGLYLVFSSSVSIKDRSEKNRVLNSVYALLPILQTNMYNVIIYHQNGSEYYYLNSYNDMLIEIEDIESDILEKMNDRHNVFEMNKMQEIFDTLDFIQETKEKIKFDVDGNAYIHKGSKWFLASDEDSEAVFWTTAFGGMIGIHKFKYGKKKTGVLYLLTCGLFGFGWVFDVLELLMGFAKDKDKRYFLPIENRKWKWLVLAAVCGAAVGFVFLYSFALKYSLIGLGNLTAEIGSQFA